MTVAEGVEGDVNVPTVSVTVCEPGTTTCQTINNILVDTMSYGLRVVNTAASQVLGSLSVETDNSGNEIAECTTFADGYTWGTVRKADVKIGGETASSIPVAIIGDMSSSTVPTSCSSTSAGGAENTVSALGVNGILGIGVAPYDCGSTCVNSSSDSNYYSCQNGTNCTQTTVALANQVTNPVAKFSTDNNGVILTMQSVGSMGASSTSGTLTFGIGTQSNNTYSASQKLATDSYGDVYSTTLDGISPTQPNSFFDSGSNAYFFNDSSLNSCSDDIYFYCPSSTTTRNVTVSSYSGTATSATVTMTIANADSLFATGNYAFNDLGGRSGYPGIVDIGLPFFYDRTAYFGYDLTALGGTQTPYVAF